MAKRRGRAAVTRAGGGAAPAARLKPGRRGRRAASSENRLADLISRHVDDLVSAVRREVRRSVADEVRGFLTGNGAPGALAARGRRGTAGLRRRVVPCIAPNCTNPSKGPRFHYLCEKHKDAPKKDYEAWRKARQEKQAA